MANPVEIVPAGSSTAVSSSNPLPVSSVGGVASGATDSGNPVKIGAVYNSTLPTVTTGQRVDLQTDARGNLRALSVMGNATGADGNSNANILTPTFFGAQPAGTLYMQPVAGMKLNGSTWDRDRKPNATSRIVSAAASTNATSAKASAGDLHCISGYNAAATVRYLKFYAKATAPTVGTDTPVITLALPPTSAFNINMNGHYIATGIGYGLTTGAADADTGALTAADIVGLTITYA